MFLYVENNYTRRVKKSNKNNEKLYNQNRDDCYFDHHIDIL